MTRFNENWANFKVFGEFLSVLFIIWLIYYILWQFFDAADKIFFVTNGQIILSYGHTACGLTLKL